MKLKKFERTFVDKNLTITKFDDLLSYFEDLLSKEIRSREELISWLENYSELKSILEEIVTKAYIDMTRFVTDEEKRNKYLDLVKDIEPKLTTFEDALNKKYISSEFRFKESSDPFNRIDTIFDKAISLFKEENIPLHLKLRELSEKYETKYGSFTVDIDNKEMTLKEATFLLKNNERKVRESAYKAIATRRLEDKEFYEDLFDQMFIARNQISENLGFKNFVDYSFKAMLRDYSKEDTTRFHQSIEKAVVPIAKELLERRKNLMNIDKIAPWDLDVDPTGEKPLKPFENTKQLFEAVNKILNRIDPQLGSTFTMLEKYTDLESRKGKAQGGYQATLEEERVPFIFTNSIGSHEDINTLLHEAGHAFHSILSRDMPLVWFRHSSIEFAEVASTSMEFIGHKHLDFIYDEKTIKRILKTKFENTLMILLWIARVDTFQQIIYQEKLLDQNRRSQIWLELTERFNPGIDYSVIDENFLKYSWHGQLHIFTVPLYYIEYAIAILGALQIFRNYLIDNKKGIENYKMALREGGKYPTKSLFEKASIKFDLSENHISSVIKYLYDQFYI